MDDLLVRQAFAAAGASAFVSKLAASDLLSTIKRLCIDGADVNGPDSARSQ